MIKFTLIILLLISNFAFAANSPNETSQAFKRVQQLRSQGKLDEALSIGRIYLMLHPSDGDVQLLVGLIYYQMHNYASAKLYLHKTLIIAPHYKEAQVALERIDYIEIGPSKLTSIEFPKLQNPQEKKHPQEVSGHNRRVNSISLRPAACPRDPEIQCQSEIPGSRGQAAGRRRCGLPVDCDRIPQAILQNPLTEMQVLRQKGQLEQSILLGNTYLKKYPKDGDILFLVGSLYFQQKQLDTAEAYLQQALAISPHDLDIKLSLVNLYLAKKNLKKAHSLLSQLKHIDNNRIKILQKNYADILYQENLKRVDRALKQRQFRLAVWLTKQMLRQEPNKIQLHQILGDTFKQLKKYQQAMKEYQWILNRDPNNRATLLALIDIELILGHERRALNGVNLVLKMHPNDPDFLALRGRIYQSKHLLAVAASEYKKILKSAPNHVVSKGQLEEIDKLNPHLLYGLNEVGVSSEIDYVSDLKEMWQYTTAFYNRDNDWGSLSFNLNNATRFGVTASQGLLNVLPVVNKNFYFRLTGAYANKPLLFPTYTLGGEGFYAGLPVELSVGYDSYKILANIAYTRYTGSVSKEIGNYLLSFRPYFYRPHRGKNSILYTATFFRYLGHKDTSLKLMLGSGTSPDLANLLTTNFLVISNNYVTFTAQFPIVSHRLLFSIGGDYQHWVFHPSNRIRNISGGIIGFNYRFED
ncbi:YaiO family outer membrane beta-barrel protein [bacterium]|nr:YaiO family outer membrane beta-barrel protein [bacterium]